VDFDLNEDQREIKSVARELLGARSTWARVRKAAESGRYDEALWRELVELGWPGIAVSEENGGQGLGIVELVVLLEELGYACAAVPFLSTAVAAAILDRFGGEEARGRWLPGLLGGETRVGVGRAGLIIDGAEGPAALLVHDGRLILVDSAREPLGTIDPTRRFGRVADDEPAGSWTADTSAVAAALVLAAIAAELVGVCQRALDMTLAYVGERRQFGVPVGSFQAVAHRCAEMLLHTESARSTAYYAAWAIDAGEDASVSPTEAAALAAAAAATGAREVTASAIQAHGGIGFTWEADVHWLYKRAEVDRALLGGTAGHHAALARAAAARLAARA